MSGGDETVDGLIKLIEANKTEEVVELLQSSSDGGTLICNTIGSKGFSPLHCAVFCSHPEIISILISTDLDVDLPLTTTVRRGVDWYEEGSTALHIACSRRHSDIVQVLLTAEAAPDIVNGGAAEQAPMHVAAEHGYLTHVQMLASAGSDITRLDQSEEMPIHKATRGGHNPVVLFLLTHGSDVNALNKEGFSPLMLSITEGHLKTTILLLENGADITCSDIELNNPLSLAILNNQEDIIPLLLDNEVNTNSQNSRGYSALHLACQLNQNNTVSLLLEVGVDLDLQNMEGQTALHIAALSNSQSIISQLIAAGVKRDVQDKDGRVAAECTNMPEIASVIEKGIISPHPPVRENTTLDMIPENNNPNNTPVITEESPTLHLPAGIETSANSLSPTNLIQPLSPRAPPSPRNLTTQQQNRRNNKLKPRANNPHTTELSPVGFGRENQPSNDTQFQQPIGVDKATLDTLKQKVSGLESQILTLGLGDDKAVLLYRQYGKLNEEISLAKHMVREFMTQNSRPLTPRMESNHKSPNNGPSDLPTPRQGAATPGRESRSNNNNSNNNGRKFNPNFMVETVESLKSELQILRGSVKPTHIHKLNTYIEQVDSMALAVVTFAHLMAVTLVL